MDSTDSTDSTDSITYIYIATLVDSTKDGDIHIGIWSEDKSTAYQNFYTQEVMHIAHPTK
jgi:hypothetical protein